MNKHLNCHAELKAADPQTGIIEAIVSVFNNVDRDEERILPGFFKASLARKLPKGVWCHDWTQPIAKTLEARELEPNDALLPESLKALGGLYIKGQFNLETQRGKEAFSDVKFGTIDEFSIGFRILSRQINEESGVTDLIEGELFEWSPVLVGANQSTQLLTVKDLLDRHTPTGYPVEQHSKAVLAAVMDYAKREVSLAELRKSDGRNISDTAISRTTQVATALREAADSLDRAFAKQPDQQTVSGRDRLELEAIRSRIKRREIGVQIQ